MTTLAERLKKRRLEMPLSLAELARRAGVSKGYLHSMESGETLSPSAEILFRIANELDTTIADLLGEEDVANAPERLIETEIPPSLLEFARQADLPDGDIEMLARIEYRGKKPQDAEDWRFIYESIKRTLR